MAHAETDRVVQVFFPIGNDPHALKCEPAPLIAKSASLTATNHAVANDSQHSTTSNSPIIVPQVSEEKGDIRHKDFAHGNPAEFTGALGDALDSVKSHSSATSSTMDGVFLTAPETPTESVDHDVRPHELFDSPPGTYNSVEGRNDNWAAVPTSPTVSRAINSGNSNDRSEQFSSVNCNSQEAAITEQEQVSQASTTDISLQEESITGARLGLKPDIFPNDNPTFSQTRQRNRIVQTPRSSRRHAIPIIRPPSPGSEKTPLEHYGHGLEGVPSHYIPLYGSSHGMFYDPITKMFIGDGPPRRTPERSDGSMPCMPENTEVAVAKAANAPQKSTTTKTANAVTTKSESRTALRRRYPDDMLHIQPRSFIDDFNLVPQPVGDSLPLGYSAPDGGIYPVGRPSNKKLYFCRCTGEWLPNRHQCNRGPLENMPEQSGLAITSQTQLPDGWVTHRIVVDPQMYSGGVVPEQTAAGPMVGGQPAKYFTSVSETGTDPRTAEAARAVAFAITQSRGASQVRAMRRGAASSDAKAPPVPRSSNNSSLPLQSGIDQPQTQSPAKDNNATGTSVVSASATSAVVAPVIAATSITTTIAAGAATSTTTLDSATAALDLTTISIPNPTAAAPDPTTAMSDPLAAAAASDLTSTPSPPPFTAPPNDPNAPTTTPTPTRALGRPATKVGGKRRHGKGSSQSRRGR